MGLPVERVVLVVGVVVGAWYLPYVVRRQASSHWKSGDRLRVAVTFGALGILISLPVMVTLPHDHGPRVFAPVWLLSAAFVAVCGPKVAWRRVGVAGALGGLFAAGALLSLAFSVSVRIRTADFTEATSRWIGAQVSDGGRVVVCDVPRTVVDPAPNGPFALHEFHESWAAQAAVEYLLGPTGGS